ncbi:MAG: 50S ribosomal protein L9 [Candidatus Nomurabacteria bacterium]|nr:50S ribosomal protein L9 [Candidatus Nomurabacteria bacterium]
MKIILTTDVPKMGNKYDIKDFKNGYANLLISKGLAILATSAALSNLENTKKEGEKKKEEGMKAFDSLVSSINNTKLNIKVKANEKGHLFKAVGPRDIVQAVKKVTGVDIDEGSIVMEHIKEIGTHKIEIKKGSKKGICEVIIEKE